MMLRADVCPRTSSWCVSKMVPGASQVVAAVYNLFSGCSVHNAWVILLFNVTFVGLPPLVHAIFEKDLHESLLYLWPQLYSTPERKHPLSLAQFLLWEGHAVFQGTIFGFLLLFGATSGNWGGGLFDGQSAFGADGRTSSADELGFILAIAVVLTVTTKWALLVRNWTMIPAAVLLLSVGNFFGTLVFLDVFMCPGKVCMLPWACSLLCQCDVAALCGYGIPHEWAPYAETHDISAYCHMHTLSTRALARTHTHAHTHHARTHARARARTRTLEVLIIYPNTMTHMQSLAPYPLHVHPFPLNFP